MNNHEYSNLYKIVILRTISVLGMTSTTSDGEAPVLGFGEWGVLLQYHYSQIHSRVYCDPEW